MKINIRVFFVQRSQFLIDMPLKTFKLLFQIFILSMHFKNVFDFVAPNDPYAGGYDER